jgi:hypothetical protein
MKRTGRGFTNAHPVAQCRQNGGINIHRSRSFTTNHEKPI